MDEFHIGNTRLVLQSIRQDAWIIFIDVMDAFLYVDSSEFALSSSVCASGTGVPIHGSVY